VAITDKIYLKNHRQIASQLDTSVPKGAFKGATLDLVFTGDGLAELDDSTQDRLLEFAEDFLDCDCQENPYCGHPERKFAVYLLELRAQGFGPDAIVDVMGDDYMLYAYSGDVLLVSRLGGADVGGRRVARRGRRRPRDRPARPRDPTGTDGLTQPVRLVGVDLEPLTVPFAVRIAGCTVQFLQIHYVVVVLVELVLEVGDVPAVLL